MTAAPSPLALPGTAACLALAMILAQAGWHALRDQPAHAATIAAYRLLPGWAVAAAAWALPCLNLIAAALLLVPGLSPAGAALAALLLGLFTAAIAVNLWRGRVTIDCGCGGARGQTLSPALLVRNSMLLVLCPLAGFAAAPLPPAPFALAGLAGAACASLYFAASQLLANHTLHSTGRLA